MIQRIYNLLYQQYRYIFTALVKLCWPPLNNRTHDWTLQLTPTLNHCSFILSLSNFGLNIDLLLKYIGDAVVL